VHLKCHKCGHHWNDDIDVGAAVVQCPECGVIVPLVLARQADAGGEDVTMPARKGPAAHPDIDRTMPATRGPASQPDVDRTMPAMRGPSAQAADRTLPQQAYRPVAKPSTAGMNFDNTFATGNEDKTFPAGNLSHRPEDVLDNPTMPQTRNIAAASKTPSQPQRPQVGQDSGPLFEEDPELFDQPTMAGQSGAGSRTQGGRSGVSIHSEVTGGAGDSFSPFESDPSVPKRSRDAEETAGVSHGATTDFGATKRSKAPTRAGISVSQSLASARSPKDIDLTGAAISGYEVKKMLGAGGMGAVCLARQVSLDRDVALKILPAQFASNPELLARFTREALSAAQLSHHNIVAVHDVGSEDDVHFISMEFVRGETLGGMVKKDGKLDAESAAGYVLQAARGLKYAHDRGIIHRDIKPDNLMVNDQGIVKIADMGLAKMGKGNEAAGNAATKADIGMSPTRPGSAADLAILDENLTMADVAMGTPAYMAPEQAKDAAGVGPAADQYSLGCTLYYLLAAKAPFSGTTVHEIISKHQMEPPPPLDAHVRGVPNELKHVINKMMAKNAKDRYPSMSEAVRELEAILGVQSDKGPYQPTEKHLNILETESSNYANASGAKLRKMATLGFFAGVPVLMVVLSILGMGGFAVPVLLGLLVLTPIFNFVLEGIKQKTYLFRRVRSVFFGMSLKGWAMTTFAVIGTAFVLFALNLLFSWIAISFLAAGLAFLYQMKVVTPLREERSAPLTKTREMFKQLRLRGLPEEQIQEFVLKFSGPVWEEYYEELFGYELMMLGRAKLMANETVAPRKRHATWRDGIHRWLTGVEEARKTAREKKHLAKVEAKRLKAQGISEKEANKQAEQIANKAVDEGLLPQNELNQIERKRRLAAAGLFKFGGKSILFFYQLARLVLGGVVCAVWFMKFSDKKFELPGLVPDMFTKPLMNTDWMGAFVLVPGVLLLISGLSSRIVPTTIMAIGALMILGRDIIIPIVQPMMPPAIENAAAMIRGTNGIITYGGLLIGLLGLAMLMLFKPKKSK